MEVEIKPARRRSAWTLRLATRAILMGLMGVVAGYVLQSAALPKLQAESNGVARSVIRTYLPAGVDHKLSVRRPLTVAGVQLTYLTLLPAAAAILGVAALVLRPMRGVLALIAMLLAVGSFALILTSMISAMAPLYQMPSDLQ
jgi:hypothetical protein